ncbi:DUF6361 family protein [Cronobacter muytjensii]|uniref:DUF6361 family protein n=1 Tax=Cronobacter muytjensii TaxID=413501 RepID=UPI002A15E423|nr:DUF6361 family protein [Cronobacter muytjensii]ELY6226773.1 hypothetical protein [Cronobacter muytjensii]ELY6276887.1 hypothetical protein [Cronobacter muytjensii]MEB8641759.1 DUF6361 family protein [Cronobacter muytjensii]
MVSTLTWIDHDAQARERTLRILTHFQEKESRDELGIGAVRDSLADLLFPGTSTIQTRLRYMLFVPWIYRSLEERKLPAAQFAKEADKAERALVARLKLADDHKGMFGKTAGASLKRLPSSVYWAGLGAWHIRLSPFSQEQYHQRIEDTYRRRSWLSAQQSQARERNDDADTGLESILNWHPRLPDRPAGFPDDVTFTLTRDEAEFIRDRIQLACPDSLLAFLALQGGEQGSAFPWEHPDFACFPCTHQTLLDNARLFSEVMHGAALSYNVQLAEKANRGALVEAHTENLEAWRASLPLAEIQQWSLNEFWMLTHREGHTITPQTRRFVEQWVNHIRRSPDVINDKDARALIENRERRLKGPRSRFASSRAREQWRGYSGTGRLAFRWHTARGFLNDLHKGMSRGDLC